jgi:hypothetical protein
MLAQTTMLPMVVQPLEVAGEWFVDVTIGTQKLPRKGPYKNADTAKAAADRYIRKLAPNLPATTNDTVVLHGRTVELTSDEGRKFVVDCVRAAEKLISDSELQEIYEISPENWAKLEQNRSLIKAIRDERKRRIRNGQTAKEAAAGFFVKAPTVLDSIMSDERASPRHRIEAAREIRQVAIGSGDESTAEATERFTITINLGADVEPFKLDVDPKDIRHNTKQIESEIDVD